MTEKPIKAVMSPKRKAPDATTYSGRFAIRLRTLREKAKLTISEVAEALEASPNTIYSWESGTRAPNVADFPQVAEVLKLKKTKDLFPNE